VTATEKIREWQNSNAYGRNEVLVVKELREIPLTDEQIVGVLTVLDNVCKHCWDNRAGCPCMNDE